MIRIRFFRVGRKKKPFYKIIVTSSKNAPSGGRFIEELGFYDPQTKECSIKDERVQHWIGEGASVSDTAHNLFVKKGVIIGKKIPVHNASTQKPSEEEPAASMQESSEPAPEESTEKSSQKEAAPEESSEPAASTQDEPVSEEPEEKTPKEEPAPEESEEKSSKEEPPKEETPKEDSTEDSQK